jgi:hypothetical protein
MQYPSKFQKNVMEPKGFMRYPARGSACKLNDYGHEEYLSITQTKIIKTKVFVNYPK